MTSKCYDYMCAHSIVWTKLDFRLCLDLRFIVEVLFILNSNERLSLSIYNYEHFLLFQSLYEYVYMSCKYMITLDKVVLISLEGNNQYQTIIFVQDKNLLPHFVVFFGILTNFYP